MRLCHQMIAVCIATIALQGCKTAPKERFYTLEPVGMAASGYGGSDRNGYSVSVGPVKVPESVDRPQFVVREGSNRVRVIEQHRWAGSLETEIARVIAANLDLQLGNVQVTSHTGYTGQNATYRVFVDIERFEAVLGDGVTVQAAWTLRPAAGGGATTGRTSVQEPAREGGYDAIAASYGRALALISTEIGNSVRAAEQSAAHPQQKDAMPARVTRTDRDVAGAVR